MSIQGWKVILEFWQRLLSNCSTLLRWGLDKVVVSRERDLKLPLLHSLLIVANPMHSANFWRWSLKQIFNNIRPFASVSVAMHTFTSCRSQLTSAKNDFFISIVKVLHTSPQPVTHPSDLFTYSTTVLHPSEMAFLSYKWSLRILVDWRRCVKKKYHSKWFLYKWFMIFMKG